MIGSHLFRIQEANDHIIVYIVDDMSIFCTGVHCRMYLDLNLRLVYIHSVQGVLSKFLLYHYQWYDKIFFFFNFDLNYSPNLSTFFDKKHSIIQKCVNWGSQFFFFLITLLMYDAKKFGILVGHHGTLKIYFLIIFLFFEDIIWIF